MAQTQTRTPEEWQKLLSVLETRMNAKSFHISLANVVARLQVTRSKDMMDVLVAEWQAYQCGPADKPTGYSRHYVGEWPDQEK